MGRGGVGQLQQCTGVSYTTLCALEVLHEHNWDCEWGGGGGGDDNVPDGYTPLHFVLTCYQKTQLIGCFVKFNFQSIYAFHQTERFADICAKEDIWKD